MRDEKRLNIINGQGDPVTVEGEIFNLVGGTIKHGFQHRNLITIGKANDQIVAIIGIERKAGIGGAITDKADSLIAKITTVQNGIATIANIEDIGVIATAADQIIVARPAFEYFGKVESGHDIVAAGLILGDHHVAHFLNGPNRAIGKNNLLYLIGVRSGKGTTNKNCFPTTKIEP